MALGVTPEVTNSIEDFKPINNRMAHMTVTFGREKAIFVIMYAPQQGRTDEEKEELFGNVQTEIDNITGNKEVIVMGDLNGHVGTTITGYEQAIGHQAIGESNAEGKRILDFCVRNNLSVMNTYYQHKDAHKWTWYGCNSINGIYDKQSQIDLFQSSNKSRIRNVIAIPSVSLDSDHRLVLMTTKYRVHKCRTSVKQKRVDLYKLNDCSERDNFAENITTKISHIKPTGQVEQDWNETKTLLVDAIEETVGFKWKNMSKKRKQTIWWNEEVKDAVKVKNRLSRVWVKERTPETRARYIASRNDSERIKRQSKKASWNQVCQDLEEDVIYTKNVYTT